MVKLKAIAAVFTQYPLWRIPVFSLVLLLLSRDVSEELEAAEFWDSWLWENPLCSIDGGKSFDGEVTEHWAISVVQPVSWLDFRYVVHGDSS